MCHLLNVLFIVIIESKSRLPIPEFSGYHFFIFLKMIKGKFFGNVLMGTCLWEHAWEHACGKMLIRKCLWESRIQKMLVKNYLGKKLPKMGSRKDSEKIIFVVLKGSAMVIGYLLFRSII